MRQSIGECVVHFTRSDLCVEEGVQEGYTQPEAFADVMARDLQMAISRQLPTWKDHPEYGNVTLCVWLDDVVENDAPWQDRQFAAIIRVQLSYPDDLDSIALIKAAVEELTGESLDRKHFVDPGDPEVGSDGYGDFES